MKVRDLYKKSKAWMFEKPNSRVYDDYIIEITNLILVELFDENNMRRRFKGFSPLNEIPQISSLDDEIFYEPEYLLEVIPKGIDAKFIIDDDVGKANHYIYEYDIARMKYKCAVVINE